MVLCELLSWEGLATLQLGVSVTFLTLLPSYGLFLALWEQRDLWTLFLL